MIDLLTYFLSLWFCIYIRTSTSARLWWEMYQQARRIGATTCSRWVLALAYWSGATWRCDVQHTHRHWN